MSLGVGARLGHDDVTALIGDAGSDRYNLHRADRSY